MITVAEGRLGAAAARDDVSLTDREADVLRSARDGGTVADIARDLHLSEGQHNAWGVLGG